VGFPPIPYRPTPEECVIAHRRGLLRMDVSEAQGLDHAQSIDRTVDVREGDEFVGNIGELTVARIYDLPWSSEMNSYHRRGDVGPVDVRGVATCGRGLIIRDNDEPPDRPFLLVTVYYTPPHTVHVAHVRGWTTPAEARVLGEDFDPGDRRMSLRVSAHLLRDPWAPELLAICDRWRRR
jgi:hypothetical protein